MLKPSKQKNVEISKTSCKNTSSLALPVEEILWQTNSHTTEIDCYRRKNNNNETINNTTITNFNNSNNNVIVTLSHQFDSNNSTNKKE